MIAYLNGWKSGYPLELGVFKEQLEERRGLEHKLKYGELGLPVMVVDGDSFEASWDASTANMKVELRSNVRVHWQGSPDWRLRATVDIVSAAYLPTFAAERRQEIDHLQPKMQQTLREIQACVQIGSLKRLSVTEGGRGYVGLPGLLARIKE